MALYEHVFLARQDLSQAQVDALAATPSDSCAPHRVPKSDSLVENIVDKAPILA